MISLLTIPLVITLVQCAHDNQRVVHVSELSSDNYTFTGHSGENGSMCCVYGNCTCNSLDHALANLTNNVLINITTDMTLFSLIKLSNLENVSIIGYNNPVVNCKTVGGVHFTFCHNCIIQGITWNECGTEDVNNYTEPGLALSYSTNIIINNCLFQYSKGQAVLLSAVSGNVNISNCSFTHNSQYRGHGAAIHYSSSNLTNCPQLSFVISDCNFTYNKHAESLVYIENRVSECNNNIVFRGLNFCHNQGSSVYAISQNIYFNKKILFQNNTAEDGTAVYITDYSTVIFGENSEVTCIQNIANFGNGIVFLRNYSNIIFDQHSVATFEDNEVSNGIVNSEINSNITFQGNCKVTFHSNSARCYGAAICSSDRSHVTFTGNANVTFDSNVISDNYTITYRYCGGTIYLNNHSNISFEGNSTTVFTNNTADYGGAINFGNSFITFKGSSAAVFDNNTAGRNGGAISCKYANGYYYTFYSLHCNVFFEENSTTTFSNNIAQDGGAIYIPRSIGKLSFDNFSTTIFSHNIAQCCGGAIYSYTSESIAFKAHSTTEFSNNIASDGGAVDCRSISFEGSSATVFSNNTADYGGAIYPHSDNKATTGTICCSHSSYVTFKASCQVTFSGNSATQVGSTIFSYDSYITFAGNSKVSFSNNVVSQSSTRGGTIFTVNSHIIFENNSSAVFNNNIANVGAAIYLVEVSSIEFTDRSKVIFNNNIARYCGVLTSFSSTIIFNDNTDVTFNSNTVTHTVTYHEPAAAAICTAQKTNITFSGYSLVNFTNNSASDSGATVLFGSNVIIEEYSTVIFNHNIADSSAAILILFDSSITFTGRSKVNFNNNIARYCGVLTSHSSSIIFNDNTEVTFNSNTVSYTLTDSAAAAAICTYQKSDIMFSGYSLVKFTDNSAGGGGATVFSDSNVIIEEYSTVIFNNNIAQYSFGAAFTCYNNSNVTFRGNSNVSFTGNKTSQDGGAIYSYNMCKITTTDNSTLTFLNNTAGNNGGAIFASDNSSITVTGNSVISFINNKALHGGAICISEKSKLMFQENSITVFSKNSAIVSGGALKVSSNSNITLNDHITVQLNDNSADYGGAIFLDTTAVMVNNSDKIHVKFTNNIGKILGSSVYQDIAELCSTSCADDKVVGISNEHIATPPNELKFYNPAICIDNDNDTQCNSYFVQNIMLGREIVIPACVLDYYNQSIDSAQFLIHSEINPSYFISGPKHVVISDTFEGITIMANQTVLKTSTNFLISITLNTALYANWKQTSVNLIIELSPCPPGFWQYPESDKCECYNYNDANEDTVFCSGSNSTIKGGYWFGSVTGKPTVTICPINYCNFTCCETFNGYYHLSPVRDNQCRSHRTGTACGSCTDGYTLSFDSTECVNINNCTAGHTVLVILLSIIYWIVMVTSVFAIMYYKVGIGYLYGITYYYSIVNILLSQNLYVNRGFFLTVSIMSSFSKITPRFLGGFCFTKAMSGIDQQFVHYMHPSAAILILVVISLFARFSQRVSLFISRGIIHVICLLLLLSYTSIASTSLLLMRSLTFHGVDKVYTYLSPDIEYFHGRHAAYGIVALLCIISIVTGLPLLLTLEPFINHKFNFTKIKPLLDQFQGCYKDKYRCFAGYYMICRLVIITIVIAKSADDFVANYILIVVCVITELIHAMVKPYNKELLNKLDTIILRLIILIAALSLSDDFDSPFFITIAVMLVISPLMIIIAITLFLHKHNLRKMIKRIERFAFNSESPYRNDVNNNEMPVREFDLVVDDSMRENNTIFDV